MQPGLRPQAVRSVRAGEARVEIFATRADAGHAAASDAAELIRERLRHAALARVVFAAAPSQDEMLAGLVAERDLDWSRVEAFHMDEYLGIDADHRASFRRYLREHLFDLAGIAPERTRWIEGDSADLPIRVCQEYESRLREAPPALVCAGIGENGHLAFNDPPVADFRDPFWVKAVRLDEACRAQQVHDGCFASIAEVPTHAYTLTIPALLSAPRLCVVVPGPRKAEAVLATIAGPISEACPASILRTHPGAVIYLDGDSSRLLEPR